MSRPVIFVLRILAVGTALTALTCQVVREQKNGDRAAALRHEANQKARGEFDGFVNYGTPITTTGVNALGEKEVVILGSKSARVVSPQDVKPPWSPPPPQAQPTLMPGSKSLRALNPADFRQIQQQQTSPQR